MSESGPASGGTGSPTDGIAEAVVAKRRGLSIVWLIPIVALLVAGGMAYRAIQERGPKVVVVFESGEGLNAGKSVVKYREVDIGTVDLIRIRDLDHVEVHLSLDKSAAPYITENTRWWVVRPRIGSSGISGLGTLVSGDYVTFEPGKGGGAAKREFVGLENPPRAEIAGLPIVLHTSSLGGLEVSSPLFFRDVKVGQVTGFELSKDGATVNVHAVIETAYAEKVKSTSRFWNAGGVEISVGAVGLDVKTESLKAILIGGVAFDSPGDGDPAKSGDAFWLHSSYADSHKTSQTYGGLSSIPARTWS
jgi:paraquat-inducible protein B